MKGGFYMLQTKLAESLKLRFSQDATQLQVEAELNQSHDDLEHDNEVFENEMTIDELKNLLLLVSM